jgi:hypothetical protein
MLITFKRFFECRVVTTGLSFFLISFLTMGLVFTTPSAAQPSRDQFLQIPFQAGVTHVDGKYGFTQNNFLLEGSTRISSSGSDAIFIYLEPKFRTRYPDKSNAPFWPAEDPHSLVELAQTAPYRAVFDLPFRTFVITAYSFAGADQIQNFATDPTLATLEEQEFYDLTFYLLTTYAGTGKTFILKHWEGDYIGLQGFDTTKDISPNMVDAMTIWLTARQRGVTRARNDAGNLAGVGVFHAVEMSRVLDYSRSGMTRVVNAVIPAVKADMASYSSYDATLQGSDAASAAVATNEALNVIKSLAPDPLNLGDKRILISEYGLFENERSADEVTWRTKTVLQTAQGAGLFGAFLWQVFDNECKQSNGAYFPTDSSPGDALRPANSQCRGLWLVKPDGNNSETLPLVSPYWKPSTSGTTITGRITSAANGIGIGGARVVFYGGKAIADGNGNYQIANVPAGSVQLTASAGGYQNYSVTINVGIQSSANFALTPSTAAGSVTGHVISSPTGTALSGVTVRYSGGSAITDSAGAFAFSAVPGGTYDFTAQLGGWVSVTTRINVQPAIASILNLRMATGAKLSGRVTNSSGSPLAGATVNIHGGVLPTNTSVQTDSSGNYDSGWIAVGSYQAVATASGYAFSAASVTLATGATTTQNFLLSPGPDFTLGASPNSQTVTAGQATTYNIQVTPVQGFTATVGLSAAGLPQGGTAGFNPAAMNAGSSTLSVGTAASTPPGTYTITITGNGGGLQHSTQVNLVVIPSTGTAAGRVTRTADGVGISGAKVASSSASTLTDANGNFTLANLPVGSVLLTASANGFSSLGKTVTIASGQTTNVSFALAANGSINGRITNASTGAALSAVTLTFNFGSTTSDANGYYTFNSVPAGTYTVTAEKTGWISASTTVTVAATAVTANIRMATGGKISGKVVNRSGTAVSGATIKMTGGIVSTTLTVTTNSSGVYTSPWIAIGNYTVQASKSGYSTQTKTATINTGITTTVNFTMQ